jgi:hypothetical protein
MVVRASWERTQQVENSSEFWSNVSVVVVTPVAIGAGLAKGVYDASTNNGPFADGFSEAATPVIRAGKNFGAEHGPVITRGVLTGAAGAVGARIVGGALRHLRI